jgi:hypothetical protein
MPDPIVTVRRYYTLDEAYIAHGFLESEGIGAFLQDQHLVRMDWLYTNVIGGLRLQVAQDDLERASAVLAAGSAPVDPSEMSAQHCVDCQGLEVSRIVRGRRAAFILWLLAGFPLWVPRSTWRCSQCGKLSP